MGDKQKEDVVTDDNRMTAMAAKHKRKDYMALYEAQPEAFRDNRPNPEILMPGDKIVLPEVEAERHPSADKKQVKFVDGTAVPELRLRLTAAGQPLKDKNFKLIITKINPLRLAKPPDPLTITTAGDGAITIKVDVGWLEGELLCLDSKWKMRLLIGKLRPVHEAGGVEQRLSNLGYHVNMPPVGLPAGSDSEKKANQAHEEARRKKATRFQEDKPEKGQGINGIIDPAFRKRLIKAHEPPPGGK